MALGYYHTPPKRLSTRVRCPVCHEEVYSRSGIHPQCAVWQLESPKPEKPVLVVATPAVRVGKAIDRALAVVESPLLDSLSTADHGAD